MYLEETGMATHYPQKQSSKHKESQNHITAQDGRDLKESCGLPFQGKRRLDKTI